MIASRKMSELNEFTIRPAVKSECRTIAELYRISSDGVAEYIWTRRAEPGEDVLDVGQRRYEQEDSVFSYQNCSIVDLRGGDSGHDCRLSDRN